MFAWEIEKSYLFSGRHNNEILRSIYEPRWKAILTLNDWIISIHKIIKFKRKSGEFVLLNLCYALIPITEAFIFLMSLHPFFFIPQDVLTITPTISVKEPGVGAIEETNFTEGYCPESASRPVTYAKEKVNLLQVCMRSAQRFFLYYCNTQTKPWVWTRKLNDLTSSVC